MTDHKAKPVSELSRSEKIREAEKMAADGVPVEVICKVLNLSPDQIKFLRQRGDADFK